jgi:hypothetical protein
MHPFVDPCNDKRNRISHYLLVSVVFIGQLKLDRLSLRGIAVCPFSANFEDCMRAAKLSVPRLDIYFERKDKKGGRPYELAEFSFDGGSNGAVTYELHRWF